MGGQWSYRREVEGGLHPFTLRLTQVEIESLDRARARYNMGRTDYLRKLLHEELARADKIVL